MQMTGTTRLSKASTNTVKQSRYKSSPSYVRSSVIFKISGLRGNIHIYMCVRVFLITKCSPGDMKRLGLLFCRWIWPCTVCAWMLKKASVFSTECIIFASSLLISSWWSPDYTVSFCCRSCWSLQKAGEKKDWNVESVVLLFCGDRKDAPACRFILMWQIIAQKLFLNLSWKYDTETVTWQTYLGWMQGRLRGVWLQLWVRQEETRGQSITCPGCWPLVSKTIPACNVHFFPTAACNGLPPSKKFWLRKSFLDSL